MKDIIRKVKSIEEAISITAYCTGSPITILVKDSDSVAKYLFNADPFFRSNTKPNYVAIGSVIIKRTSNKEILITTSFANMYSTDNSETNFSICISPSFDGDEEGKPLYEKEGTLQPQDYQNIVVKIT